MDRTTRWLHWIGLAVSIPLAAFAVFCIASVSSEEAGPSGAFLFASMAGILAGLWYVACRVVAIVLRLAKGALRRGRGAR